MDSERVEQMPSLIATLKSGHSLVIILDSWVGARGYLEKNACPPTRLCVFYSNCGPH